MDILDEALDGSQGKDDSNSDDVQITQGPDDDQTGLAQGAQLAIDPNNLQYQFNTGQGPVTYRVVQVASQDGGDPQAHMAVIQSPFNGSSPTAEADSRAFTYFPATVAAGGLSGGAGDVVATSQAEAVALAGQAGQFYVMMSPQDVLQGQRNIAPRNTFQPKMEGGRTSRDDRRRATHNEGMGTDSRRATHNEVERRRRDKINNWIVQLSKLVPDCSSEHTKGGQLGSKGGILSKACDYINELKQANMRYSENLKDVERLNVDHELLRQQVEDLKNENLILRSSLQSHGIHVPDPGSTT
ncbi:upstream stimulatory factor 1-like isoform X2 [Mya arenaria]|uniref:upstream stimulatory factor 1-like isoform X2 n=1 Tax=Mya arenaria TaxID=6604 RepID=UPI0022E69CC4|nr:upstream stimulatory factor 1-like isoform X2 [Mya arenaria]